jgi:hypothetical protein
MAGPVSRAGSEAPTDRMQPDWHASYYNETALFPAQVLLGPQDLHCSDVELHCSKPCGIPVAWQ